jgi:hypothetical protein
VRDALFLIVSCALIGCAHVFARLCLHVVMDSLGGVWRSTAFCCCPLRLPCPGASQHRGRTASVYSVQHKETARALSPFATEYIGTVAIDRICTGDRLFSSWAKAERN